MPDGEEKDLLCLAECMAKRPEEYAQKITDIEKENTDLKARVAELEEEKETIVGCYNTAIQYSFDADEGELWLKHWFEAATYKELVDDGWDDSPKDAFIYTFFVTPPEGK